MDLPRNRQSVLKFARHPLAFGSFLVFTSTLTGNVFAYLYNIFMARMLGPHDYGSLAATISLMSLVSVFSGSLTTTVTKFVSIYKGLGETEKIGSLIRGLFRSFFVLSLSVVLVSWWQRKSLSEFFNLPLPLLVFLVGLMFAISLFQSINLGAITGLQLFGFLAGTGFLGSFLKFASGLTFVYWGWRLLGAGGAVVFSSALVLLFSFVPLRKILFRSGLKEQIDWRAIVLYGLPAAVSLWAVASLTNADVVLVKKYFPDFEAGIYSFAALVGRVIFFASSSISSVMFPMVSERQASGQKYKHLFYYVLLSVFLISSLLSAFYFAFPVFTLNFFSGFGRSDYLAGAPFVGFLGLYYLFFSVANSLVIYFLSTHQTLVAAGFPMAAALLQIIFLGLFHQSLIQVVMVSLAVVVLLNGSLLVYFLKNER